MTGTAQAEGLDVPFVPQIALDRDSEVPLYQQIAHPLEELILAGRLEPGRLIEDEVSMARRLKVSRPTTRRALRDLVASRRPASCTPGSAPRWCARRDCATSTTSPWRS